MRTKKSNLFAFCILLSVGGLYAQDKTSYKFGKLAQSDFNVTAPKFDSGANAVIIADIGSTKFEGNTQGSFNLIYTRYMRIKIINKNGFEIGSRRLFIYHDEKGNHEKISSIKGSTFNIENGEIRETRLDEKSIFNTKGNKDYDIRTFTLPALKEGSIFDLEYTIRSPFTFLLRSWDFQGEYPRLWSEYTVTIAPPFHYVMKLQGDTSFDINSSDEISSLYHIRVEEGGEQTQLYSLTGPALQHRWVKKNVPSLHEEPFTTTVKNYNTSVSFQLNYFQWTEQSERRDHMTDWAVTSKTLMEEEDFGQAIARENFWISDKLNEATRGASTDREKVYNIFSYVRDNFNSGSRNGEGRNAVFTKNSLKDVYRKKEGNVAEINLLLVAMLRKAGIDADPIILSTRDNGIANTSYPLIEEYNYVICAVYLDGKMYKLDASQPYIGFNQLPEDCYNGLGHVINEKNPQAVNFSADTLHENSVINVLIMYDEKGMPSGNYKNLMGKIGSYKTRREIGNSSIQSYKEKIQTDMGTDIVIENFKIDSLNIFDFPLTVDFDFQLKNNTDADILYFDPIIEYGYKVNPFKAMDRHYPVEMPYLMDERYVLNMDIPTGFVVDELPKSTRVNYNGSEGLFEYIVQKGESNIRLDIHLKLNKTYFPVEEYSSLREFFTGIVKMENEKIVFKKKH
jgi:hypothetical protein